MPWTRPWTRPAGTAPAWWACRRPCWPACRSTNAAAAARGGRARECMGRCSTHAGAYRERGRSARLFAHYMREMFGLDRPATTATPEDAHRWRVSYLKLLQGWGLDANGAAGAVLKGWAESRFGLLPAFHKAPLGRFPSPAWVAYLQDKGAALTTTTRSCSNWTCCSSSASGCWRDTRCWAPAGGDAVARQQPHAKSRSWPGRCARGAAPCG
jgi:hypothetical protein